MRVLLSIENISRGSLQNDSRTSEQIVISKTVCSLKIALIAEEVRQKENQGSSERVTDCGNVNSKEEGDLQGENTCKMWRENTYKAQ